MTDLFKKTQGGVRKGEILIISCGRNCGKTFAQEQIKLMKEKSNEENPSNHTPNS